MPDVNLVQCSQQIVAVLPTKIMLCSLKLGVMPNYVVLQIGEWHISPNANITGLTTVQSGLSGVIAR